MVIVYIDVNKKTVKDGYQIIQTRVLINRLKRAKVFSKFDAKSGFWQVKMHPDSIPLTAFGTPQGHYEWLVMSFGLKQAPSIFQRKMDNIFKHVADFCVVYIDDILVFSKTKEEHMKHLYEVVKLIVQHGIIPGEKKVFLVPDEIDFLGLNIKNRVIKLQPHILEKIWKFPDKIPDAKSLQRFLGVINYGRDFLPKIAGLTAMLSPKTSSKRTWKFTEDDEKIVKQIKDLCKNLPPLHQPEENDEIILQTDASDNFLASVVLARTPGTNTEKILKFCSGEFSPAEQNYPTGENEILAESNLGLMVQSLQTLSEELHETHQGNKQQSVVPMNMFKKREIYSTLACAQWIEKIENDKHYKVYEDTDMEENERNARSRYEDPVLGNNSEDFEDM
ncbi:PREDICTED: enzymatic polyprotein-like [Fragaria vesca subsp. vesca]